MSLSTEGLLPPRGKSINSSIKKDDSFNFKSQATEKTGEALFYKGVKPTPTNSGGGGGKEDKVIWNS